MRQAAADLKKSGEFDAIDEHFVDKNANQFRDILIIVSKGKQEQYKEAVLEFHRKIPLVRTKRGKGIMDRRSVFRLRDVENSGGRLEIHDIDPPEERHVGVIGDSRH